MSKLSVEDLDRIAESARRATLLREGAGRAKITVHMGTCGIAAGARKIMSAVMDEIRPIFEYMMLNWPDVRAGKGIYRDSAHALDDAAARVNEVYRRYGEVVRNWESARSRKEGR